MTEKLVYSVEEVSKLLGCSRNLAYRLCRQKVLPVLFLGSKRMVCPKVAIDQLLSGNGKDLEASNGQV